MSSQWQIKWLYLRYKTQANRDSSCKFTSLCAIRSLTVQQKMSSLHLQVQRQTPESEIIHHGQQVVSFVAAGIFWLICKLSSDSGQLRTRLHILSQTKDKQKWTSSKVSLYWFIMISRTTTNLNNNPIFKRAWVFWPEHHVTYITLILFTMMHHMNLHCSHLPQPNKTGRLDFINKTGLNALHCIYDNLLPNQAIPASPEYLSLHTWSLQPRLKLPCWTKSESHVRDLGLIHLCKWTQRKKGTLEREHEERKGAYKIKFKCIYSP